MSESKAQTLRENRDQLFHQLARLIGYIDVMQQTHPELDWPPLPDEYSVVLWENSGVTRKAGVDAAWSKRWTA